VLVELDAPNVRVLSAMPSPIRVETSDRIADVTWSVLIDHLQRTRLPSLQAIAFSCLTGDPFYDQLMQLKQSYTLLLPTLYIGENSFNGTLPWLTTSKTEKVVQGTTPVEAIEVKHWH
jgi:hypothetical protein